MSSVGSRVFECSQWDLDCPSALCDYNRMKHDPEGTEHDPGEDKGAWVTPRPPWLELQLRYPPGTSALTPNSARPYQSVPGPTGSTHCPTLS